MASSLVISKWPWPRFRWMDLKGWDTAITLPEPLTMSLNREWPAMRSFFILAVLQLGSSFLTAAESPSQECLGFVLKSCDRVEGQLDQITRAAETMASRHLAGGAINTLNSASA